MKTQILNKRQGGFGIIEIVITLLVIGIGLLAITSLQNSLMFNTGVAKARTDAIEVAQQKIEELRGYIEQNRFNADLVDGTETVSATGLGGRNTDYALSWTVASPTDDSDIGALDSDIQEIKVTVAWTDASGEAENVYLSSYITFADLKLAKLPLTAEDDDNKLFGPQTSGTEGPDSNNPDDSDKEQIGGGDTPNDTSDDVYVDSYTYRGEPYTDVIVDNAGTNTVVLTVYGGVVHHISGKVVSDSYDFTSDITAAAMDVEMYATSPAYCIWPMNAIADDGNGYSTAEYVCYFGGDCFNGSSGFPDVNGIPDDGCLRDANDAVIARDNLNGGWYGGVGVLLVNDNQGRVCAGSDIGPNELMPAHSYVAYRLRRDAYSNIANGDFDYLCSTGGFYLQTANFIATSTGDEKGACYGNQFYSVKSEGINQSLECHDFVVFDDASVGADCADVAVDAGVSLPLSETYRLLSGNKNDYPNLVLPTDDSLCPGGSVITTTTWPVMTTTQSTLVTTTTAPTLVTTTTAPTLVTTTTPTVTATTPTPVTTTTPTVTTTTPTPVTTTTVTVYTCECQTTNNKNTPSLISGGGCCSLAGCEANNPKQTYNTYYYTCP